MMRVQLYFTYFLNNLLKRSKKVEMTEISNVLDAKLLFHNLDEILEPRGVRRRSTFPSIEKTSFIDIQCQ